MRREAAALAIGIVVTIGSAVAGAQELAIDALERANSLASKGKLAEAVPFYEKAIELDGPGHTLAYLNLAEVQKVRGKCREASLMFQLYASVDRSDESKADADRGVKECKADKWPRATIQSSPAGAVIKLDGFLASIDGTLGPIHLPPGEHQVTVEAKDHHPATQKLIVGEEDVSLDVKLEKMLFNGKLLVKTNVPEAKIRIFEGPSDSTKVLAAVDAPMTEPVVALEGRHFVEVTADGYQRWIRNVSVSRDEATVVEVTLTRARPPELDTVSGVDK